MPYIPNTPESRIARSDSKNPHTTCAGLSASGRPCRRAIPPTLAKKGDEALYCWQHSDQSTTQASPQANNLQQNGLKGRSSVDTLAERLGLLDVEGAKRRQTARKNHLQEKKKIQNQQTSSRPRPQSSSLLSSLCCFSCFDEPDPAPLPARVQTPPEKKSKPQQTQFVLPSPTTSRPSSQEHLKLIPSTASPELASRLLAELTKPISDSDEEGYIYMFWLTSTSAPTPPKRVATDLLDTPPVARPASGRRRTSEVMRDFSTTSKGAGGEKKTVMLKIGRANNVARRMNEWKRQCGYDLSLIRYYPYQPQAVVSNEALKTPFAHKVERLIHIELAEKKMDRGKCSACGREHKEWFEVDASRNAVKAIDEVIRRWVDWSLTKT